MRRKIIPAGEALFSSGEADDPIYKKVRDRGPVALRDHYEQMWSMNHQYLDPDFLVEVRKDFKARMWELYLVKSLRERDHILTEKRSSEGPDACSLAFNGRIWFEAILPGPGETNDKVMPCQKGEAREVPTDKVILRLCGAIETKYIQYQKHLKNKIISSGEPFVIAICGVNIMPTLDEDDPPFIVKAVFPIGPSAVRYNLDLKHGITPVEKFFTHQPEIVNHNQKPVMKDIFLDRKYESISGILYSAQGIYSAGDDFVFVHNPLASAPLPQLFIQRSTEYLLASTLKKSVVP